jgi:hypothetical protein
MFLDKVLPEQLNGPVVLDFLFEYFSQLPLAIRLHDLVRIVIVADHRALHFVEQLSLCI